MVGRWQGLVTFSNSSLLFGSHSRGDVLVAAVLTMVFVAVGRSMSACGQSN